MNSEDVNAELLVTLGGGSLLVAMLVYCLARMRVRRRARGALASVESASAVEDAAFTGGWDELGRPRVGFDHRLWLGSLLDRWNDRDAVPTSSGCRSDSVPPGVSGDESSACDGGDCGGD